MRKFNLKDHAAKRIMELEKAGRSETSGPAKAPGEADDCLPVTAENLPGIRIIWATDVGRLRKNNQDAVIIGNGLAGVADGMGGHNAGEIASGGLRDGLLQETMGHSPDKAVLEAAVKKINRRLYEQQQEDTSLSGMGTTLTVLWPTEEEMIIAQVGDSRAYLIRDGKMIQMTADHSMVADMVRNGVLTEEQAACHPMRNYITRAVGTDEELDVDIYTEKRETGDRWLVCSDGLYGLMSRSVLAELAAIEDPEEAVRELMQTALENGGRDNISMVLLDDHESAKADETAMPDNNVTSEAQPDDSGSAVTETPSTDETVQEGADA